MLPDVNKEEELEILKKENQKLTNENINLREKIKQLKYRENTYHNLIIQIEHYKKQAANFNFKENNLNILLEPLELLLKNEIVCDVVLVDKQGLLVADSNTFCKNVNKKSEALAAVAAMCDDLMDEVSKKVSIGKIQQINMINENGISFLGQTITIASDQLILMLLINGQLPTK